MIIFQKKKIIFFKSYKTAGTAIETELSKQLQESDIQCPFGFGEERMSGQNHSSLRIGVYQFFLSLRNPLLLASIFKTVLRGEKIIHEHTTPEVLLLFFPKFMDYQKIVVSRDAHEVNFSNYRMHKKRYKYTGTYEQFLTSHHFINNDIFDRYRWSQSPIPGLRKFNYVDLEDFKAFLKKYDLNVELLNRVNT